MSRILVLLFLSIFPLAAFGQGPASSDLSAYGVTIEPDRRVMVVLAALEMASAKHAAGVEEKLIKTQLSEQGTRFRATLLADNAGLNAELRNRISTFVAQHKKRYPDQTDDELVSQFISMAYTLSPVPELADPAVTGDLPGRVLDVLDFAPLAREFYRRSTLATKLEDYVKEYRRASDRSLRGSAVEMVGELLDYLHTRPSLTFIEKKTVERVKGRNKLQTIETIEHERRFVIVPESLAPRGDINFVNIRDDYFVVVPADADLIFSEARRAFLQFVVDPLVLGNAKEISVMRDWAKPILDEQRRARPGISADIYLAVTRSLVAAIDVRQAEFDEGRRATDLARQKLARLATDDEKRQVTAELEKLKGELADETARLLYEDYENGAVLAFYFAHQLKGVEDSGFDIASSLREMIASFDPAKETERVSASSAARARALAARQRRKDQPETPVTRVDTLAVKLGEIQKTVAAKDYVRAETELKQLLAAHPGDPVVYYNIGRVASLAAAAIDDEDKQARKLLEARTAYGNVISAATSATDKALLSLTYVALGRIYEHFGDAVYALKLYDEAIKLGDIPGGGMVEAAAAKARLTAKP